MPGLAEETLYSDVCQIIDGTRGRIATFLNTEICMTNWYIGKRIKEDVLFNQRAEYGKQVIKNLSLRLIGRYGSGWSEKKLRHCIRSAETFSEQDIVSSTQRQLTWTHLKSLMYIKDPLERQFYAHLCGMEHWDTRTLDEKIDQQLYQRTAISRKPEEVIKQELAEVKDNNQLLPDLVFRSSYFLDMLGLPDVFTEKDLESAIITQIEGFIKELGSDFTFVARQKRITVDATDYYLDLLFFHRELRRLVAIDLKLGKFKPEHEGQMLLYLRYLNQNERKVWEESPISSKRTAYLMKKIAHFIEANCLFNEENCPFHRSERADLNSKSASFVFQKCQFCIPIVPVLRSKSASFATQNGAFYNAKWCVLQCKMVRFTITICSKTD